VRGGVAAVLLGKMLLVEKFSIKLLCLYSERVWTRAELSFSTVLFREIYRHNF